MDKQSLSKRTEEL